MFPCAGDDEWLALRLVDRSDVDALADVLGVPGLVAASARRIHRDDDAIEELISAFTSRHDTHVLAARSQAAGLEAFPVLTPPELVDETHLAARGFFVDVRFDGRHVRLPGSPLYGLADPGGPAPRFGEHTQRVVELLRDR